MRSFPKSGDHFNKKVEQVVIKKERNLSNESEEKFEDIENNLRRPGRETKKPQRYGQTSSYFIYDYSYRLQTTFTYVYSLRIVEVVTTSRKTPHLVFLAFSSAEAIDSI